MPYRRLVSACVLAALVFSSLGSWGAVACSIPSCDEAAATALGSPSTSASSHAAPAAAVLRGAGNIGIADLAAPDRTPVPTATPVPPKVPAEVSAPAALRVKDAAPEPAAPPLPSAAMASPSPDAPPTSLLADNQVVVLYGLPGHPDLGVLGAYSADDGALAALARAAEYDAINGPDGTIAMLDLVYGQAQAEPTANGLYLRYLSDRVVRSYLDAAERHGVQLMLDLQIGRGDPLEQVRRLEKYLKNPRVHVAIDPEYAVGPDGVPIETPGAIDGRQVNAVQEYLSTLVERYHLPPKLLVVHQYLDDSVRNTEEIRPTANVELVVNMDAFGDIHEKARKYSMFANHGFSSRHGFNIFLQLDERVLSNDEVLQLSPRPDIIFYQ